LFCGYLLAGLPTEHACPECGFEYDAESIKLPVGLNVPLGRKRAIGVLTLMLLGFWLWRPGVKSLKDLICLGMIVIGVVAWLRMLWTPDVQGVTLVAGRKGLYSMKAGRSACLLWNSIGCVKRNWVTGALIVFRVGGQKLLQVSVREFKTTKDIDTCVAEINRARRLYTDDAHCGRAAEACGIAPHVGSESRPPVSRL